MTTMYLNIKDNNISYLIINVSYEYLAIWLHKTSIWIMLYGTIIILSSNNGNYYT